ncbi:MAG: CARDB domain-containing protein, partial [bacterium]
YHNSTAYYSTNVTSGHNNGSRVGLINSIACYPGNFEYSDCLAEASHNCATGGALNVIMNSRYGWGTPPLLGPSEKLDIRFYDYFFNHDTMPIGLTHAVSKEVYRQLANQGDGAWRWCYFELNYFGDPLQLMYEQIPAQLDAQFTSPINIGIQNFTVTVRSGSNPVSGALVCLWKGSEVYTRNYTNAAGQVTFSINPTTAGYMYVTATKPNYLPDRDSAQVIVTNFDVGVTRIIQPPSIVDYGNPVAPQARVRNFSPVPVTNCPVRFSIGNVYTADTIIPYIGVNDSALATFPLWTAQPPGYLSVRCSTMLAGDTYPANNRQSSSVFVRYRDVGVVSVSVPATVDSGTAVAIQATVRNYGNTNETFPIALSITGTGYAQSRTKTLAAGAIDTVNFPAWTALQRGTHTVRCSTELAGDHDPTNDRATANVFVRVRDVACTKILSPIGTVDSTSSLPVQARVRNFGNTTENFRAVFRITGTTTWIDSALVNNLAPGESVNVSFNSWPCGRRGTYTTACSTKLSGDLVPANNLVPGSFIVAVHDLAVRSIISPSGYVDSSSLVPIRVAVANLGSVQEENAKIFVSIGSYYRDSLSTTINSGATDTVNLSPWRVNAPRGILPVLCSVYVANDCNHANDTLKSNTTVIVHDVTVVTIVAPTGDVDSGTAVVPRARVRNIGSVGENFPCRFTISDGYLAQLNVSVPAGTDTVISFPTWHANSAGTFSTKCTTLLAYDQNPANDRATGTVRVVGTDVGIVAIIAPSGDIDPGDVTPAVRVANYSPGNRSFTTFLKIVNSVSGTIIFSDSAVVNLLPADSTRDIAYSTWSATPGTYTVRCSVGLGDPNPQNDTLSTTCRVVMRDIGLVSLSPQGDMRPMIVSPIARAKNFGSIPTECQVFLTIIDTVNGQLIYSDSVTTTELAPGETRDIRFPSWAATIGYYRLTANLVAPGDAEPANDTLNVKLRVSPGALGWQRRPDLPPGANPVKQGAALAGIETDSARIYALRGNKTPDFYVYNVQSGFWRSLPPLPPGPSGKPVRKGGALCSDGERYVYATKGNGTLEFWRYDAIDNTWVQLPDVPAGSKTLKGGTGLAYVHRNGGGEVYLLKGSNTYEFYVYSVESNTWSARAQAPAGPSGKKFKSGSALCAHGADELYAIKSKVNEFYLYSIDEDAWHPRTPVPEYSSSGKRSRCGDGCGITSDGNMTLYALSGGNRNFFYCYNLTTNNWYELSEMPEGPAGKRVKAGGAVTFLRRQVWALRGNGTNEFYVYIPDTMSLFSPPPAPRRTGVATNPAPWEEKSLLTITPNPAHHNLNIILPGNAPLKFEIFNSIGTPVKSLTLAASTVHTIDISEMPNGIYIVRVSAPAGGTITRKLVIQR